MSQASNPTDSAGVPWEGRSFAPNAHAGDDGSADPALLAALEGFRAGSHTAETIVDALRSARVLIPLVAERGDEGVGPSGLTVDKTQELSIVSLASPDGRTVLPVFSSVAAMQTWDASARPIPVEGARAALAAAAEETDLMIVDPKSVTEFLVRRPALWAIGQNQPWVPASRNPIVQERLTASIAGEPAVVNVEIADGDPQARMHGPELVVILRLLEGLDRSALNGVLERLSATWAADEAIVQLADSMTVKIVRAA